MDRDMEIHRLTARLRALRRYCLDLCLGHIVSADDPEPVYVGRLGLTDTDGQRLLIDWRSPAAAPFFGATHANPMGVVSRRRYRWTRGRVSDYWDEVFTPDGFAGHAASLDDQSAFIASLGKHSVEPDARRARHHPGRPGRDHPGRVPRRSRRRRRSGDGQDCRRPAPLRLPPLLRPAPWDRRGGVLFVGPHQPYLAYVADVLPSLGEEGVRPAPSVTSWSRGPPQQPRTLRRSRG